MKNCTNSSMPFRYTLVLLCSIMILPVSCKQNSISKTTPQKAISPTFLKIENANTHIGIVNEGDTIRHSFYIQNTGNQALVIFDLTASCNCTSYHYPKESILPKEKAKIDFEIDTEGKNGAHQITGIIKTNTKNKYNKLEIQFKVVPKTKN